MSMLDGIRAQVAFEEDPDKADPSWTDVTGFVELSAGIGINRGRGDTSQQVGAGQCSLTLDNRDGRFTDGNTGSPYAPWVIPNRRLRVSYRDPASLSLFSLDPSRKAAIEDGSLSGWWGTYFGAGASSTIAADTTRCFSGSKSVKVTWPTLGSTSVGAGVFLQTVDAQSHLLVKGRTYVVTIPVFVPAGSPAVRFGDVFGATPVVQSTVTDRWQLLQISWTATGNDVFLGVKPASNPTAGQLVWVDAPQVDEAAPGQYPATAVDAGRMNRTGNPSFETDAAGWTTSAPISTITKTVHSSSRVGGSVGRVAIVNAQPAATWLWAYGGSLPSSGMMPAAPGEFWAGTISIREVGTGGAVPLIVRLGAYDAAGGFLGVVCAQATGVTVPAGGAWLDIDLTSTAAAPANTAYMRWLIYSDVAAAAVGDAIDIDGARADKVSGLGQSIDGDYFDGDTVDAHPLIPVTPSAAIAALGSATVTTDVSFGGRKDWTRIDVSTSGHGGRQLFTAGDLLPGRTYRVELEVANDEAVNQALSVDINDDVVTAVTLTPGERRRVTGSVTVSAIRIPHSTYRFLDLAVSPVGSLLVRDVKVTPVDAFTQVWTETAHASASQQFEVAWTTELPPARDRFTGWVDGWPTEVGRGRAAYARVSAQDRISGMGLARELRSVPEEEILQDAPQAYYPLGEAEDSESFGSIATAPQGALTARSRGSGGLLTAAAGTGAPTDGMSAPVFAPTDGSNGQYLTGELKTGIGFFGATLRATVNTSVGSREQVAACLVDMYGTRLEIGTNSTGRPMARVWNPFAAAYAPSVAGSSSVADGQNHDLTVCIGIAGGTRTTTLYVDGVSVASTSDSSASLAYFGTITVGGGQVAPLWDGTISHVAASSGPLDPGRPLAQWEACTTGFENERSDERVARYATWLGVPAGELALEVGKCLTVAHRDTAGVSPLQAMQDVAVTESGQLFADPSGRLVLHARDHRYVLAPSATVTELDAQTAVSQTSVSGVVNDVTVSRPGGATVRAVDEESVARFRRRTGQVTMYSTSDTEVEAAAAHFARERSTPRPTMPAVPVDLLTLPDTVDVDEYLGLDFGDVVNVVNLPTDALPASVHNAHVEGYSESISTGGWLLELATSPRDDFQVWVLGDDDLSVLGETTRLAY